MNAIPKPGKRGTYRIMFEPLFVGERTEYGMVIVCDGLNRAKHAALTEYPIRRIATVSVWSHERFVRLPNGST